MTSAVLANGDELCLAIEKFAELEWRKFQSRIVNLVMRSGEIYHEDNSKFPPFTSFRFKRESVKFVDFLKYTIDIYDGDIKWCMSGHQRVSLPGKNWVIKPLFVDQVSATLEDNAYLKVRDYISTYYPDFAPRAYADLLGLERHVSELLQRRASEEGI